MLKKSKKRNKEVEKIFSATEVGVLLEHLESRIDIMIEGQKIFEEKTENRFDNLEGRFDNLENIFDKFESETSANFKAVFTYLSRIEDEIVEIKAELKRMDESKADRKELNFLKMKIEKLEKEFVRYKIMVQAKAG